MTETLNCSAEGFGESSRATAQINHQGATCTREHLLHQTNPTVDIGGRQDTRTVIPLGNGS